MISPNAMLTAAHIVYWTQLKPDDWGHNGLSGIYNIWFASADQFSVLFHTESGYIRRYPTKAYILNDYKKWADANNGYTQNLEMINLTKPEYDIAVLVFDEDIGYETGWMGITAAIQNNTTYTVSGYPGDKNMEWTLGTKYSMWKSQDRTKYTFYDRYITTEADTYFGNSGGPFYKDLAFYGYQAAGIVSAENEPEQLNYMHRITNDTFSMLKGLDFIGTSDRPVIYTVHTNSQYVYGTCEPGAVITVEFPPYPNLEEEDQRPIYRTVNSLYWEENIGFWMCPKPYNSNFKENDRISATQIAPGKTESEQVDTFVLRPNG